MPIVRRAAEATVFCAVWNEDPDRERLVRAHAASLDAQEAPVAAVYIFDAGDEPPEGLPGTHVLAPQPLTIYQAWSLATQVATTTYVMNCNLDDRLWPAAVSTLVLAAEANDASVVGADWRVTFDEESTETLQQVRLATDLGWDPAWPPRPGVERRLGSGTRDIGSLGVGSMWRRDLHDRMPYPWAFADGTPILSIGDIIWWRLLNHVLRLPLLRLPLLIGNYRSHPTEQAEFRLPDETSRNAEPLAFTPYPLDGIEVRR